MENKILNAIAIFGLGNGQFDLDMIKSAYRKLASANHPDKGGKTEVMQLINCAYEELTKFFIMNQTLEINEENGEAQAFDFSFLDELKAMQGLIIEVCGYWIWLGGNSYFHRAAIKALGFKFSGSKKAWYWSPVMSEKRFMRGTKPMEDIRKVYGSQIIKNAARPTIN